jgi:hypothetical protein
VENRWVFEQDDDLRWRWIHLSGDAQQQSVDRFQQPMDCVMDAVRHVVMRRRALSEAE